jgi:hypothetical protein
VKWIKLTPGTIQWQALVKTVISVYSQQQVENLETSRMNASVSPSPPKKKIFSPHIWRDNEEGEVKCGVREFRRGSKVLKRIQVDLCFVGKQPRIVVTQIWLSSCFFFLKIFNDSVKTHRLKWKL